MAELTEPELFVKLSCLVVPVKPLCTRLLTLVKSEAFWNMITKITAAGISTQYKKINTPISVRPELSNDACNKLPAWANKQTVHTIDTIVS